jgi:hypothetical protein
MKEKHDSRLSAVRAWHAEKSQRTDSQFVLKQHYSRPNQDYCNNPEVLTRTSGLLQKSEQKRPFHATIPKNLAELRDCCMHCHLERTEQAERLFRPRF